MVVFRRTLTNGRSQLRFTRYGIVAEYLRPRVGGGYYVKTNVVIPWTKKGMW